MMIIRTVTCVTLRYLNRSVKGIQVFYGNNSYSYVTPIGPTEEKWREGKIVVSHCWQVTQFHIL